ncbi:hypothetical protein [Jeongeupia chitinilytica]|uniref:DUF4148 domain-containing protein n=1 Tax=Jeongeupia chitinilytica TaxID=1041641 RepID=A0ABQ3GWZ8_9NEIS|nr:hypothetical protein [Jeongeupia chitinilytica]GHD56770.1 hypothetical protein GCM10007350_04460 [Jeongeupia chitinilytica]
MSMKSRVALMSLSGFLIVGMANAAGEITTARISDIENQIRLAREQQSVPAGVDVLVPASTETADRGRR